MTSWVLNGQDPTEVKTATENRLRLEEQRLEALRGHTESSKRLTSNMVEILNSFENRLKKLEETILPVYQETENLQRRQENIDKTLESLDHVIAFYNVSKEVESVVRGGPNQSNLEAFLGTMSRLKGALDYFEKSNPQSIELENVKTLYEMGGDSLSREFSETLKKNSRLLAPIDLINGLEDEKDVALTLGDEDVKANLQAISEWLNLNDRDEFMNVYANVRGSVMKKSLDHLKDYHKSQSGSAASLSSPGGGSAKGAQGLGDTPRKVSGFKTHINRRISSLSNKMEVLGGKSLLGTPGGGGGGTPTISEEGSGHHHSNALGEWEINSFCISLTCLQKLLQSEQILMVGIVPHQFHRRIFERISRDSMDAVVNEAENIVQRAKKVDFLSLMSIFHVIKHISLLKPSMDRTLEGTDANLRSKFKQICSQFSNSGSSALENFIDGIRADPTTKEKMPKDGTVFQLTSNVLLFLEQLLDFIDTIAAVLQQDTSYNQTLVRLPRKISVSDRNHALVGLYVRKVLVQLNLTLINKSDSYPDPFLKAVFRLNNNQYILRSLHKTGLMDIVCLAEPDCDGNYRDMVLEQKRLYSQSWTRVLNHIWADDIPSAVLQAPGKLGDKYCRLIKEKFAGFNREMEDIAMTQRSYFIPDAELRESLKRDNKEYILPKYSAFYDKYANVEFTKYPEKYVKFTPAQVSALIDCFFDAAA